MAHVPPSRTRLKISIVIPAFNEEKLLDGTLRSIRDATRAFSACDWDAEIIVCDNNSTDRTPHIARKHGATVVFEPENGIARARNRGAAAATGAWLIFIDADSQPSENLFADVATAIKSGKFIGGGATLALDEPDFLSTLLTRMWNLASRIQRLMAGSFIFCEAAAFREVGGFDAEIYASEEIWLSKRLKRIGRKTNRKLTILHRHSLITSARKMKLYSPWEIARFMLRAIFRPRSTIRSREACHAWYDGRR